jgi:hypothetical protein
MKRKKCFHSNDNNLALVIYLKINKNGRGFIRPKKIKVSVDLFQIFFHSHVILKFINGAIVNNDKTANFTDYFFSNTIIM